MKSWIVVTLLTGVWSVSGLVGADVTMQPITKEQLIKDIQAAPLQSYINFGIISRAYNTGMAKDAYDQYTLIWQRKPHDAYANLWRGDAAYSYWHYATRPDIRQLRFPSPQEEDVKEAERLCLSFAQANAPKSAATNAAYGNYLFWDGGQMTNGINFIMRATTLDPKAVTPHAFLGAAYSTQSGNAYSLAKAEHELKLAASLDANDAYPHWKLVSIYLDQHRYQEARRELQAYLKLVPASVAQSPGVRDYQSQISKAIGIP